MRLCEIFDEMQCLEWLGKSFMDENPEMSGTTIQGLLQQEIDCLRQKIDNREQVFVSLETVSSLDLIIPHLILYRRVLGELL